MKRPPRSTLLLFSVFLLLTALLSLPPKAPQRRLPSFGLLEGTAWRAETSGGAVTLVETGWPVSRLSFADGLLWLWPEDGPPYACAWRRDEREGCRLTIGGKDTDLLLSRDGPYLKLQGAVGRRCCWFERIRN